MSASPLLTCDDVTHTSFSFRYCGYHDDPARGCLGDEWIRPSRLVSQGFQWCRPRIWCPGRSGGISRLRGHPVETVDVNPGTILICCFVFLEVTLMALLSAPHDPVTMTLLNPLPLLFSFNGTVFYGLVACGGLTTRVKATAGSFVELIA